VKPQDYVSWGFFIPLEEKRSGALMSPNKSRNNNNGATLGFEQTLWQAAGNMRRNRKGQRCDD